MSTIRLNLLLAGGLCCSLATTAVSAQEHVKKYLLESEARLSPLEMQFDARGDLFVRRAVGDVDKYDSRLNHLWTRSPLEEPIALVAYGMAVSLDGEVLLAGVSANEGRESYVVRIDGEGTRIEVLAAFSGFEVLDVEVAPDGKTYLLGYDVEELNARLGTKSIKPVPITVPIFHELGADGQLTRSFGHRTFDVASEQSVRAFLSECSSSRLRFSPAGGLYAYSTSKAELQRLDLSSGRVTGRIGLTFGGPVPQVQIGDVRFLGEDEVFYSLAKFDDGWGMLGREARVLSLSRGESLRRIDSKGESLERALVDPGGRIQWIEFVRGRARTSADLDREMRPARREPR